MKPWLYRVIGSPVRLLLTENGIERLETKVKLKERLKELGVKGYRGGRMNNKRARLKSKYSIKIKRGEATIFHASQIPEEALWVLCDLADTFSSQDEELFTEIAVSKD